MPNTDDLRKCLRFGVFEADLRNGELTKLGRRLPLQDQPFRLLVMLLEKPGQLVTRDQLRERLWPETTVDFDHGLNKAVSKIRDALGDSAENPRFIETVPRRGYRFLADVFVIDIGPAEAVTLNSGTLDRSHITAASEMVAQVPSSGVASLASGAGGALKRSLRWRFFGYANVAIAAIALLWLYHARQPADSKVASLAVLPLANLSGDASQDYLADGMTEELITRLGQDKALRVISRTSAMTYKNVHKPLSQIARELGVQSILEGSVLRLGGQVRITAQLIDAGADRHIWAQSYTENLGDVLAVESSIAREITARISTQLDQSAIAPVRVEKSIDPAALDAYLKGRFFWNKRTVDSLGTAIDYFKEAIRREPSFAKAYSGLADCYALAGDWLFGILPPQDAFIQAKDAARKALLLDDSLGEAHTSLAFALDLYGWDWDEAQRQYLRALELSPGYATAHHWYAWHLIVTGQTASGIAELKKAQSFDPLSLIIGADLADALCVARRYDESLAASRRILDLDPNFAIAYYEMGQTFTQLHRFDEAANAFKRAIQLGGPGAAFESNLGYLYAVSGNVAGARQILRQLEGQHNSAIAANIALINVGLGDTDAAISWLHEAYGARFNPSLLMRPAWDRLRPDPRFKELLLRLNLRG